LRRILSPDNSGDHGDFVRPVADDSRRVVAIQTADADQRQAYRTADDLQAFKPERRRGIGFGRGRIDRADTQVVGTRRFGLQRVRYRLDGDTDHHGPRHDGAGHGQGHIALA